MQGDLKGRKSTSRNIILMGNNPHFVGHQRSNQSIVATSTTEAEYVTSDCVKKIL